MINRLIDTLPTIYQDVVKLKDSINTDQQGDILVFFRSETRWPEIPKQKKNIKYIESLLEQHLVELRKERQLPDLKFVRVAGIEYLLEVPNSKSKKVPDAWIKISHTKAVSRYHTQYIIQQLKEREQHRELLTLAAEEAYKDFLK